MVRLEQRNGQLVGVDSNGNEVPIELGDVNITERSVANLGAAAYLGSNQTLNDTTFTKIALDTAKFDDSGEFDATNNQFDIDTDGRYIVNVIGRTGGSIADGTKVAIQTRVNGTTKLSGFFHTGASTSLAVPLPGALELVSGDTLEMYMWQNSGSSVTIQGGNPKVTYMDVTYIG